MTWQDTFTLVFHAMQVQYMLGSSGRSYVVGLGDSPPTHIPSPAASCPAAVQPCAGALRTSAQYLSPGPNPHVLAGALVSGPAAGCAAGCQTPCWGELMSTHLAGSCIDSACSRNSLSVH